MKELIAIQSELKAPKSQYNNFGKYAYRNCEDILEAVKPLLKKYGACLTVSDELVHIDGRFYVKATATVSVGEASTSATAYAREADTKKGMDESQITGSASSYARKYALNGLFLIDDTKDADTTNTGAEATTRAKNTKKSQEPPFIERVKKLEGMFSTQFPIEWEGVKTQFRELYGAVPLEHLSEQELHEYGLYLKETYTKIKNGA